MMRSQIRPLLVRTALVACLLAAAVVHPGAQAPAPDIDSLGPQVGEAMLPFSGTDQFGNAQSLESVLGPNGAMVVFFRSADW
ncbi:MAG: hypothetical protein AB7H88_09840 [Vicinamibacterales bacterium]